MNGLIESILISIIIPEVADILRGKPEATDAEIIAAFQARRERIISQGRAFLRDTSA